MNKNIWLSLLVAIALITGATLLRRSEKTSPPVPQEQVGVANTQTSNNSVVNGVTEWTLRRQINTASTTLCSFANPAGSATSTNSSGVAYPGELPGMSTSTLISLSVNITTGTSTAATFDVATSTSAFATSTRAFMYASSIAANETPTFNWNFGGLATSSDARLTASMAVISGDQYQVRPAEFVNVKTAGAGLSGYTYGGQCIARFRSVSAI